ncbi:MAG TPA: peptide chain release factor N(5)-glutamine methyltransferase [Nitrospira sp.]|nr:peptide chain release factor N(5)-glutamine methyltransferase [Nitrospira sp.]
MKEAATELRTIRSISADMRRTLRAAGIESVDQESIWLLGHALHLSALQQSLHPERVLTDSEWEKARSLTGRRAAREPLQYILGSQEFYGLEFEVDPTVLIPRPETQLLPKAVIRRLPPRDRYLILDVGTGSGCLAIILARAIPHATILATDISTAALQTARKNARRHGVDSGVKWLQGDLLEPVAGMNLEGKVDAIVSNPPYISESEWQTLQPEVRLYEPRTALVAGPDGTEMHERLLEAVPNYLRPGGFLVMELGQGQSARLQKAIYRNGAYQSAEIICDDAGIDRIVIADRARTDVRG